MEEREIREQRRRIRQLSLLELFPDPSLLFFFLICFFVACVDLLDQENVPIVSSLSNSSLALVSRNDLRMINSQPR